MLRLTMVDYAELLEHELRDAVEVKNPDSLHRYRFLRFFSTPNKLPEVSFD